MNIVSLVLMLVGSIWICLAGIGVLRLDDIFLRMSASTKAATLGVSVLLLGSALSFGEAAIFFRALVVIIFLYVTAPIAAHMIGKAAFMRGVKLSPKTVRNDLKEYKNWYRRN